MIPEPVFLVDPTSWDDWQTWFRLHAFNLVLILGALAIALAVVRRATRRLLQRPLTRAARLRLEDAEASRRRAETLIATLNWSFALLLLFVGIGLVLSEVGVNVATLIAGFGIVGIAVGLGAQAFVKDIINGVFILSEDQYRVGDIVTVAAVTGEVIDINPRRTVVRDDAGAVHSIPNGAIVVATNQTQGFSRISLDVPVTYDTDIERAIGAIRGAYEALSAERPGDFLAPAKVVRLNALLENYAVIRVNGDVRVGAQWELTGELRARLKARFEAEGITMTPAARWTPRPEY